MSEKNSRPLMFLLILGSAGLLGLGVLSYLQLTSATIASEADQRFLAERLLYYSLIATTVFLTAGGAIFLGGFRLQRRLDHLIEQSRYRQLREETDFRGFGAMGRRLRDLFRGLSVANDKLTRKLASQGVLLEMIISNSPSKMLISDSQGKILFISKGLLESLKKEKQDLVGKEVSSLWEKIDFPELRSSLEEKFQPANIELEEYPLTAYPVASQDNLVAYVFFNAEKRPFFYAPGTQEQSRKNSRLQRDLSRLLRSGKSTAEENG